MNVNKLLRKAYNEGFTDDPHNLPECVGSVHPEFTQSFNCAECPLKPHCLEVYTEWLWK